MKMCWLTEEWRCAGSLNNEDVLAYCNAVSNYTDMATHWVIGDPYWFTGDVVNHWRCRESLEISWITGDVVNYWRCRESLEMSWITGDVVNYWICRESLEMWSLTCCRFQILRSEKACWLLPRHDTKLLLSETVKAEPTENVELKILHDSGSKF